MACHQFGVLTKDTRVSNSANAEYTIHVNNLPGELNEHGFLQIFTHYGEVIGHFYRPNADWGYITYSTSREAQNAIKDLHNVPPLRLKVSFAREKGSKEVKVTKASVFEDEKWEDHIQDVKSVDRPFVPRQGKEKLLETFKRIEPNTDLPKYNYTADSDLLYTCPSDPHTYNPYENAEPYANTNALWTRGQLTITQDGKRHVSLGRGYTMYEIPDPYPEVQNHISKVYEKRTSGLYQHGQDMLQNTVGKCQRCSNITKLTCERCHSFYCSRNCQVVDWPQHKFKCQAIPALVSTVNSVNISQLYEEQIPTRGISSVQMPLRRPRKSLTTASSDQILSKTVSKDQDITEASANICNDNAKSYQSNVVKTDSDQHNRLQGNDVKKNITTRKIDMKHIAQAISNMEEQANSSFKKSQDSLSHSVKTVDNKLNSSGSSIKKRQNFNAEDVMKMEEDIAFSKHTFLSKSKFTDVRIIVQLGREFWIQKVEDNEHITKLMIDLQHEASKAQKVNPVVGQVYAVQYEGVWHRAVVTCLSPLTVHYVDYGNDDVANTNDFREISKFKLIPRYCAKIRLSEETYEKYKHLKYEDVIAVKMISIDTSEVINVEIQEENPVSVEQAQTNDTSVQKVESSIPTNLKADKVPVSSEACTNEKVPTSFKKLENIVNTVPDGVTGILEIHAELRNNVYGITLLTNHALDDFEKLLNDLPAMCEQKAGNTNFRPQIGEIICGQRVDGDWLRGYVLSLESPLKMAIIDEARMMEITKALPCPETFLNICAFGVTCEVIGTKHKFSASEQYEFKVVSRKQQNEIEIEFSKDPEKIKAIVKPWTPMPEQKGLQYTELKNGSEVCLTAYRSHVHLFARSLDAADLEHYNYIMQNIAKCAQTAPPLTEQPVVGQMVIAHYVDNNYYRAIVTKVQAEKIAISYVDFGNTEVTSIKKLRILSDHLKQLRSCTSKIVLKDVPQDTHMTKEISDYLSVLVGTEIPLTCTFDGIPSKDGVYLKSPKGENINETIREMLVPTWNKTGEDDTTCYTLNDLNVISLGKVGDIVKAIILHSIEDGYKYTLCPLDYNLVTHVLDIMPKMMTEYCEASKTYIPREEELCLAYDGSGWYRAVCLNRSRASETCTVFFVDFGNIEDIAHENIRLMPKDFITPEALASVCRVVNLAPTENNIYTSLEIKKQISESIVPNDYIQVKIVEYNEEDRIYDVELPLIREKLIEDGLISK
ncbi:PREDICTED: uncharacterized protein LOC107189208 isoform X2 [Dufourea novaeangliae]|uniref:uncharacterized protein LOC107189208 isoform X2 n=1 Tax=Dufourea novaeangliae TaxID=178035 RepID=UPI0007671049|nr:PREDICTED: uncharacterized protein LOC107189208 isoform X2 [Dufourea novaeangliae]